MFVVHFERRVRRYDRYHDSIEQSQIEDLHCQPKEFCGLVWLRCFLYLFKESEIAIK